MKRIEIKDFFFAGIIFGIISGLFFFGLVYSWNLFGITTRTPWGDVAAIFFNPPEVHMFEAELLGFILALAGPVIIAILLCLLVKLSRKDYIYVKSIVISEAIAFFTFAVFYPAVGLKYQKHSIATNYSAFVNLLIFSLILGYLVKRFTDFNSSK